VAVALAATEEPDVTAAAVVGDVVSPPSSGGGSGWAYHDALRARAERLGPRLALRASEAPDLVSVSVAELHVLPVAMAASEAPDTAAASLAKAPILIAMAASEAADTTSADVAEDEEEQVMQWLMAA
jgi:hypothetical protein